MAYCMRARGLDGTCRLVYKDKIGANIPVLGLELTGSVGENAKNFAIDVRKIQEAFNDLPEGNGRPNPPLKIDAICGPKTIAAIRRFQKDQCGFKWPDGRIEPERRTHQELKLRHGPMVPPNPYTIMAIYSAIPQAMLWINQAHRWIGHAIDYVTMGSEAKNTALAKPYALVDRYFHVGQLGKNGSFAHLKKIQVMSF